MFAAMKYLSLLVSILLLLNQHNFAACSGCNGSNTVTMHPSSTINATSANTWMSVDGGAQYRAGHYAPFSVQAGATYNWTNCSPCTGSALSLGQYGSMDAVLTLMNASGTVIACANTSGNANSPNTAYLTWTASFTGTVYLLVTNEYYVSAPNCDHSAISADYVRLAWRASTVPPNCSNWSVSPSSASVSANGDNDNFTVYATGTCSFNYQGNCSWATFTASGSGGTINYTVDPNCGSLRSCTCTITDASTGANVATFIINQLGTSTPSVPNVTASPNSICNGQTSNLSINNTCSGCNYQWSAGCSPSSGSSTTVTAPGTYFVTVSDDCNHTASGSVTIQQNTQSFTPQLNANPTSICPSNQTATISVTNASSCNNCQYQWSGGNGSGSTTTVNTPGNYSLTVTNSCNQTSTASATVGNSNFVLQAPQLTASPTSICGNQTSTINVSNASAFSGCTGCTYNWSSGTGGNLQHTVTGPGNYSVTITNSCNQSVISQVTINNSSTPPQTPIVLASPSSFCSGSATLQVTNAASCSQCTYMWSAGCIPSTGANTTITQPGTYTVTVTNSCSLTAIGTVTVNSNPTANILPVNPGFCPGGSVQLNVTQGSAYLWSDGSTGSNLIVSTAGSYSVTVTNPGGCTGSAIATAVVTGYQPPIVNAGNDQYVQLGSSATLGGTPTASGGSSPYNYIWSGNVNNPNIANPTSVITNAADFCVTVTDAHSCSASDCVHVDTSSCSNNISLDHTSKQFGLQGGQDTIIVNAQNGCSWSVSATSWVTIISGQNGSGSTPLIRYSVGLCPDNSDRNGTLTVAGQTFSVNQHCQCTPPADVAVIVNHEQLAAENIAGASYQWQLNGVNIPAATSRFYTCTQPGIYTVSVCTSPDCCTSIDIPWPSVSIDNIIQNTSLKVYPNPTKNILHIDFVNNLPQQINIKLYDALGQVALNKSEVISPGNVHIELGTSIIPAGIYQMEIAVNGLIERKKLVIQK
jgi:hypothetical protein